MGINSPLVTPSLVKRGVVAQRHDGVRNLLTTFIDKICNNVEIDPRLQPLDNERFHLRSAVTSSEARLDIKAGGFWARGVTTFFLCQSYARQLQVLPEQANI